MTTSTKTTLHPLPVACRPHLHKGDGTAQGVLGLGLAGGEELSVCGTKDHHVEEALVWEMVEEKEEDFLSTRQ